VAVLCAWTVGVVGVRLIGELKRLVMFAPYGILQKLKFAGPMQPTVSLLLPYGVLLVINFGPGAFMEAQVLKACSYIHRDSLERFKSDMLEFRTIFTVTGIN